jgi:hypothetical protein
VNRDQIFDIWCPPSARWSPWVKPVSFSFISDTAVLPSAPRMPPAWDVTGLPTARENVALVLDLPGGEAVRLGMTFLAAGFRPVPLYNALPWVEGSGFLLSNDHPPVVNMIDVVEALRAATPDLAKAQLPDDAPPAFMLDANRRRAMGPALPGSFDNRSISFPTDFPSANFLLGSGIPRAVVILGDRELESDLAHTLRQWQDAGIHIELKRLDQPEPPRTIQVVKPAWYRSVFHRALELLHFRKSALGGFGGVLPEPSSG